jgi:hypothetical protein
MTNLFSRFLSDAERLVDEDYNDLSLCELDWYAERLTEANYDSLLEEVRAEAAMAM